MSDLAGVVVVVVVAFFVVVTALVIVGLALEDPPRRPRGRP